MILSSAASVFALAEFPRHRCNRSATCADGLGLSWIGAQVDGVSATSSSSKAIVPLPIPTHSTLHISQLLGRRETRNSLWHSPSLFALSLPFRSMPCTDVKQVYVLSVGVNSIRQGDFMVVSLVNRGLRETSRTLAATASVLYLVPSEVVTSTQASTIRIQGTARYVSNITSRVALQLGL